MFSCSYGKIFWWDRSRKFKNTRRKGTQFKKKFKKQEGKNEGKKKKEIFYIHGGSHTHVFSICQEHPCATLYEENPLIWGPPHQPSALPENEANREGGIMKKAMPSWMKKTLLDEKICFYKVTSKYTAKFLAGYILRGGRTLLDHQPWADYWENTQLSNQVLIIYPFFIDFYIKKSNRYSTYPPCT